MTQDDKKSDKNTDQKNNPHSGNSRRRPSNRRNHNKKRQGERPPKEGGQGSSDQRNRRPNQSQGQAQGQSSQTQKPGDKRPNNNRRRNNNNSKARSNNRYRRGNKKFQNKKPLSPEEKFLRKYEFMIRTHDEARKSFFEQFHRVDDYKRRKLELAFWKAGDELREFESKLTEQEKDLIAKSKYKPYKLDSVYSENHNADAESPPEGPFDDPMMLESQIRRDKFLDDAEESKGSIDDYKKYKGL